MIQELIFTSARRGLQLGKSGFCTVASTAGMAENVARLLESLSGYRHLFPPGTPEAAANPVNFSHLISRVGGKDLHIFSRVADAGLDYSGRSNKLAHHIACDSSELPPGGPAALLRSQPFETRWDREPERLPPRKLAGGSVAPGICATWERVTGDAGWGGALAEAGHKKRPAVVIVGPGAPSLELVLEALALLPENVQEQVTFSTFYTNLPANVQCLWRFVLADSPEAAAAKRNPQNLVIDCTAKLGVCPSPAADEARQGRRYAPKVSIAAPVPGKPVADAPLELADWDAYELPSSLLGEESAKSAPPPAPYRMAGEPAASTPPDLAPPPRGPARFGTGQSSRRSSRRDDSASDRPNQINTWGIVMLVVGILMTLGGGGAMLSTIAPQLMLAGRNSSNDSTENDAQMPKGGSPENNDAEIEDLKLGSSQSDHSASESSSLNKSAPSPTDQPPTDQPPTDQPPTDQPPTDQPPTDQPSTDSNSAQQVKKWTVEDLIIDTASLPQEDERPQVGTPVTLAYVSSTIEALLNSHKASQMFKVATMDSMEVSFDYENDANGPFLRGPIKDGDIEIAEIRIEDDPQSQRCVISFSVLKPDLSALQAKALPSYLWFMDAESKRLAQLPLNSFFPLQCIELISPSRQSGVPFELEDEHVEKIEFDEPGFRILNKPSEDGDSASRFGLVYEFKENGRLLKIYILPVEAIGKTGGQLEEEKARSPFFEVSADCMEGKARICVKARLLKIPGSSVSGLSKISRTPADISGYKDYLEMRFRGYGQKFLEKIFSEVGVAAGREGGNARDEGESDSISSLEDFIDKQTVACLKALIVIDGYQDYRIYSKAEDLGEIEGLKQVADKYSLICNSLINKDNIESLKKVLRNVRIPVLIESNGIRSVRVVGFMAKGIPETGELRLYLERMLIVE